MERIILGILAGVSIDVVEAGEKYIAWMKGDHLLRGETDYDPVAAPIAMVVAAKVFLDNLEAYALAG